MLGRGSAGVLGVFVNQQQTPAAGQGKKETHSQRNLRDGLHRARVRLRPERVPLSGTSPPPTEGLVPALHADDVTSARAKGPAKRE